MTADQLSFLKEVFEEMNGHIRSTDRKSLLVSGWYITVFSVFLSSVAVGKWSETSQAPPHVQVFVEIFFLLVGTCTFVMQHWYRAWKMHYLAVCLEIRKIFLPELNKPELMPYWLQANQSPSSISTDNLLKYLVIVMNYILLILICRGTAPMVQTNCEARTIDILAFIIYTSLIIWSHIVIRHKLLLKA